MKVPKWQKPLTASERRHLREMGITTRGKATKTAMAQAKARSTFDVEPCWECRTISRKLGLPLFDEAIIRMEREKEELA